MKIIKYASVPVILSLAACVSISNVVPAGKDTWMVAGSSTIFGTDSTMKADLYKTASDFCISKTKYLRQLAQIISTLLLADRAAEN